MANEKLIDPNEFWERLNKASYDVITYPDREMDSAQFGYYTDTIEAVLNQTKKVDAVEVVHGRWKEYYDHFTKRQIGWICTNCSAVSDDLSNGDTPFCPHCGALMDLEDEEDA